MQVNANYTYSLKSCDFLLSLNGLGRLIAGLPARRPSFSVFQHKWNRAQHKKQVPPLIKFMLMGSESSWHLGIPY